MLATPIWSQWIVLIFTMLSIVSKLQEYLMVSTFKQKLSDVKEILKKSQILGSHKFWNNTVQPSEVPVFKIRVKSNTVFNGFKSQEQPDINFFELHFELTIKSFEENSLIIIIL